MVATSVLSVTEVYSLLYRQKWKLGFENTSRVKRKKIQK